MAEYYFNSDTDVFLAVVPGGIFTRRDTTWSFHPEQGRSWDRLHQAIYRDGRFVSPLTPAQVAELPPLPAVEEAAAQTWADSLGRGDRQHTSRVPLLAEALADGQERTVYVVLDEDTYETAVGDGEFHYLKGAFLSEEKAKALATRLEVPYKKAHLRVMSVQRQGDQVFMPVFAPQTYDQCTVTGILGKLEESLAAASGA